MPSSKLVCSANSPAIVGSTATSCQIFIGRTKPTAHTRRSHSDADCSRHTMHLQCTPSSASPLSASSPEPAMVSNTVACSMCVPQVAGMSQGATSCHTFSPAAIRVYWGPLASASSAAPSTSAGASAGASAFGAGAGCPSSPATESHRGDEGRRVACWRSTPVDKRLVVRRLRVRRVLLAQLLLLLRIRWRRWRLSRCWLCVRVRHHIEEIRRPSDLRMNIVVEVDAWPL